MSNYPVNTFQNALEVARAVCDSGGSNSDVQKSVIAHALQSSANSGAFIQRLASTKIYGMIEGGRNGYRLTEDAKRYFFPSSEGEKRNAFLMLLKSAPIFAEIIKRFDGNRIPSSDLLANVLLREFKVPESWKDRVARFFLKAAGDAGVLDAQGFLRYAAARQSVDHVPASASSSPADRENEAPPPPPPIPSGMNAWVFSLRGKTVKVETSDDLSPELWKKLDAYIQVLKPFQEGKSK
jgi:hypothetical protein